MPLPPAPSRRAAILAPEAYEASARTRPVDKTHPEVETRVEPASRSGRKTERSQAAAAELAPAPAMIQVETKSRAPAPSQEPAAAPAPVARRATSTRSSTGTSKPAPGAPAAPVAARSKKAAPQGPAKLFVLDTNVLLHDPTSLFRFEEHDIFLPMIVLEELDGHKKGMTEVARNGRQTSRTLDALAGVHGADIAHGLKLDSTGQRAAGGHLFFQTVPLDYSLPTDFWVKSGKNVESWQSGAHTYYRIGGPIVPQLMINQFVYFEAPGEPSLFARVSEIREKTAVLQTLKDYGSVKHAVWGVTTRNREQNYAMNLLMDPEVDFVTLTGTAGTGKTLLALAAGLTQVLDDRRYTEIIMTRATVSVGEDIGFLPGTEEEKMGPWMGALDDNLEFLAKGDGGNAGEWGRAATNELIRSRIKIKSMNFMRGRTFLNKYVIIDEAQNLTPKQMKTLITRAGPGTKIICMGNLAQIDTPYLTEGSSGLTYAVDRFKGWPHSGHITLARGERSRLADFASEVL